MFRSSPQLNSPFSPLCWFRWLNRQFLLCAREPRQSLPIQRGLCMAQLFSFYPTCVVLVVHNSGGRVQCSSCRSPAVTFVLAWCILQVLLQLKIWAWILEMQTLVSWLLFCVHFLHLWSRVTSTSCNEQFVIQGSISLMFQRTGSALVIANMKGNKTKNQKWIFCSIFFCDQNDIFFLWIFFCVGLLLKKPIPIKWLRGSYWKYRNWDCSSQS